MVVTFYWIVCSATLVGLVWCFLRMIGVMSAGGKAHDTDARELEIFALTGLGLVLLGMTVALTGAP